MTAIIAAACTYPSGPELALADIAHRLRFALISKHPLWTDRCQVSVKACYFPEIVSASLVERFQQLLRQILMELTKNLPEMKHIPPEHVGVLLPPLNRPGVTSILTTTVKETLLECTGWHSTPVHILHGGRAETIALMNSLPQGGTRVLLAVDSWLSPPSLMWLEDEHLLHGAHRLFQRNVRVNPYGRVPSEGAAALVIGSSTTERQPWCHIRGEGQATEAVLYSDTEVCLGTGLRQAALQALGSASTSTISHIVSDFNGESYRADELGFTLSALCNYTDNTLIRETPVLASGDLGCASLLAHMALTAWRMHSSEQSGDTLLLSSSDDGQRGAIVMSKQEGARHADH